MTSTSSASRPPVAPSLRARKRLRTRRDLQCAAIGLVEHRGYQNTSVEDVCEEAEVSRSTFFRYFGSKAAVFEADLIEELAAERWQDPSDHTLTGLCELICSTYRELSPEQFEQERRRIRLLQTATATSIFQRPRTRPSPCSRRPSQTSNRCSTSRPPGRSRKRRGSRDDHDVLLLTAAAPAPR